MKPGLYKAHGGHFMIVTSVHGSKAKFISTVAGELQLHNITEQRIREDGWELADEVPLVIAIDKFVRHMGGISEAAKAALLELKERNMDVKTATTKELVDFYNKHSKTPVKKFKDRATAEARVHTVLDELKTKTKTTTAAAKQASTRQVIVTVIDKRGKKKSPELFRSIYNAFEHYGVKWSSPTASFRKNFHLGKGAMVFDAGDTKYEFNRA
jgi:hypothetical protein